MLCNGLMVARTDSTTRSNIDAVVITRGQLVRSGNGIHGTRADSVLEIRGNPNYFRSDGKGARKGNVSIRSRPISISGVTARDVPFLSGRGRRDGLEGGRRAGEEREKPGEEGEEEYGEGSHGKGGLFVFGFLTFSGKPPSEVEEEFSDEDEGSEEDEREDDDDGGEGKRVGMVVGNAVFLIRDGNGLRRRFGGSTGESDGNGGYVHSEERDAREGLGIGVLVVVLTGNVRQLVDVSRIEVRARLGEPYLGKVPFGTTEGAALADGRIGEGNEGAVAVIVGTATEVADDEFPGIAGSEGTGGILDGFEGRGGSGERKEREEEEDGFSEDHGTGG